MAVTACNTLSKGKPYAPSSLFARLGFAMGTTGISVGAVPSSLFLLYYLTEVAGMRAALAGVAMALPKIWDAVVDPAFGGWVDRTAIRMGRRGPIVLVSCAIFIASQIFTFMVPHISSPLQMTLLVTGLLIVSSTSQTAFNVSQYALAAEMTSSSRQLGSLLSLSGVIAQIFTIAGVALAPLVIQWWGNGASAYATMAIAFALVSAPSLLIFYRATRTIPVSRHSTSEARLSLWASLRATLDNRPFYFLIAFLIFQGVSTAIVFAFLPFANQYVLHGDASDLSVLEVILFAAVMLGMSLTPVLLRYAATVRAMRWCNAIMASGLSLLFLASFGPVWCTWAASAMVGIASGTAGVLLQAAILEVAQTRLKDAVVVASGFYIGIMVAGTKLGNSAGGFVSGALLDISGFVSNHPIQSATALQSLRAGYTLVPLACVVVAGLFLRVVRMPPPALDDEQAAAV